MKQTKGEEMNFSCSSAKKNSKGFLSISKMEEIFK